MFLKYYNILFEIYKKASEKGLFHLLLANFSIKIFGFASQLFVAWILLAEDIGRISIFQSYLSIGVVAASFGFNASTLKLCSENRTNEERYSIYHYGQIYNLVPIIATFLILLILSYGGYLSPDPLINKYFWLFALGLYPLTHNANMLSFLQALKQIKVFASIQLYTKLISVFVIVFLTYFFGLIGYLMALLIGYFITYLFLQLKMKAFKYPIIRKSYLKTHFTYSIPSLIANFIDSISYNFDIILLNYFILSRTEIGYYGFALVLNSMLMIIASSLQQIAMPYFSEASGNFQSVFAGMNKYKKKWLLISFLIMLGAMIVVCPLLYYFREGKYINSIPFFLILASSWFFRSNSMLKGAALFGGGYVKINLMNSIVAFITTIITVYFFIMSWGTIGAAFGILVSCIFNYFYISIVLRFINNSKQI